MAVEETRIVTKFLRTREKDSWTFDAARKYNKAYSALEKALGMEPAKIVEEVQTSGLRGRGGAGFERNLYRWTASPQQQLHPGWH